MKLNKYFLQFKWMKVYFSPFKFFLPKLYVGKTAIGVPYFMPRKWIPATPKLAHKRVLEYFKETEDWNRRNPEYFKKIKPYDEAFKDAMTRSYSVPKKTGFDFVRLGWKTKFDSFRWEFNPIWSFVCFGYQIALIFAPENDMHYWESYIAYEHDTDKTKSAGERVKEAMKKHPNVWTSYNNRVKETIDYFKLSLKNNYVQI